MKKLLALLLLFSISGCVTSAFSAPAKNAELSDSDSADWKSSNNKIMGINYRYKVDAGNHSVTIKTNRKIKTKHPAEFNEAWREICFSEFNSFTKEFIPSPKKKLNGFHEWSNPFILKCHDPVAFKKKKLLDIKTNEKKSLEARKRVDDIRNETIKRVALNKAKILEERKSKCREYGFKDNTDGMGLCLIELDKLDAIKNQATAANLAQSNLIAQQQAEAKKQRQSQALINLGAMIGGAGVPSTTRPKPLTPSYSNSYSSSRTVPSNQNCPLLNVPLKKQEVKGGNRICYY